MQIQSLSPTFRRVKFSFALLTNDWDEISFSKAFSLTLSKKAASLNFRENVYITFLICILFLVGLGVNFKPRSKILIWYLDNNVVDKLCTFDNVSTCVSSAPCGTFLDEIFSFCFFEFFVFVFFG